MNTTLKTTTAIATPAQKTTIANGEIETIKIEAENGLFSFLDMFTLVDFEMDIEHEEDHMSYHGMVIYRSSVHEGPDEDDAPCIFCASISKVSEYQNLRTKEEAFKDDDTWAYEYFEVIFKNDNGDEYKEREYYCLGVVAEEVEAEEAAA